MLEKVFSIQGNTLLKCLATAIGEMSIPQGVTKIAYGAFENCGKITKVILPDSITNVGAAAFKNCKSLASIDFGNTELEELEDGLFDGCKVLQHVKLPDSVVKIGDFAFRGCANLRYIELPTNIDRIGEYAFAGCSSLTEFEPSSDFIEFGQKVFAGCLNLRKAILPKLNTTIPNGLFFYCRSLEEIQLGIRMEAIGNYAFMGCESLQSIDLSNIDIKSIGWDAFADCINLISIGIQPDEDRFSGCVKLGFTKGYLDSKPNSVNQIGRKERPTLPATKLTMSSKTSIVTQEDVEALGLSQDAIYEIVIPKHIRKIEDWAFCGNPIIRIVIENPDCEIGDGAFFVGGGLLELHLVGFTSPPQHIQQWFWGDTDADSSPEYLKECRLYVPKGTAYLYNEYEEDYPILNVGLMDVLEEYTGTCSPNPYLFFKEIVEE